MAKALPQPWTVEGFLAFEAEEPERYEFVDGIARMMAGGSAAHSVIKNNVTNALNAALGDGACSAYVRRSEGRDGDRSSVSGWGRCLPPISAGG